MAHLETAGMYSCALISIGGIKREFLSDKNYELLSQEERNQQLKSFQAEAESFYNSVIFPTDQPCGRTKTDYPLQTVLEGLKSTSLTTKAKFICINQAQYKQGDVVPILERYGFKAVFCTDNSIGGLNYIYVEAPKKQDWDKQGEFI